MRSSRLDHITKIGVEDMGALADSLSDPQVLRLENLDTDLRPPRQALAATKAAVDEDDANSYLPFVGLDSTRRAATSLVSRQSGIGYDWKTQSLISAGGLSGILNVLLALIEPGDEVLLTDPIYVGLINRVRLAGGVPRFVPLIPSSEGWRLDLERLAAIDPGPVKLVLTMSPSMPTGHVMTAAEWAAMAEFCQRAACWLLNDSAMERILFDGREVLHPASLKGMADRVITVGSVSKEYRMIGWRVGWVVGPAEVIADTARVSISNVVCQGGVAMKGATAALNSAEDGVDTCAARWQRRRDLLLDQLQDLPVVPPHGGWSLLVDTAELGFSGATAARLLLQSGKIAATPMTNWGSAKAADYLRLVYSNEPCERLKELGARVRSALDL